MASVSDPLSVGKAVRTSLLTYRSNVGAVLLTVAVAIVPANALYLILQSATIPDELTDSFGRPFWTRSDVQYDVPAGELSRFVAALGIGGAALGLATMLATAACCVVIADALHGREIDRRRAWGEVGRRVFSLVWLLVLAVVLLGVALLLLVIPGIWLAVAWTVAIPALMFEDHRGTRALERSFRLTRHRWWATLGGILLIGIIGSLISLIFWAPAVAVQTAVDDFFIGSAISGTLNMIASVLTAPLWAALITVFFFDLRARKEPASAPEPPAQERAPAT